MARTPRNKSLADQGDSDRAEQEGGPAVVKDNRPWESSVKSPQPSMRWRRGRNGWQVWAVCGFLVLAVGIVFGRTLRHGFVSFDDNVYVYDNPQVNDGLTTHGMVWAFTSGPFGEWYPLTMISHMLDCQFYGQWAGGHHLTSMLLHAATAIMLFLVLHRMTGDLWPSAFVAAVFAIHPLRVESVAWLAERRDVLSGLFFMLTLWAYVCYVQRPSLARYLAVPALFALGLMAKPMLVTLPFLLLLLDYWPLGRFQSLAVGNSEIQSDPRSVPWFFPWDLIKEKVPLFALAGLSCGMTLLTHSPLHQSIGKLAHLSLPSRIANAVVSYVAYLGQLFYPVGLAPFYPHPGESLSLWKVAGALVVLTVISVCVILWRRKYPYLLVGWFWYLGMMAPVVGLVRMGMHAMADRYTYLSQIGLYVALAWGAAEVSRSWPNRRGVLGVGSAVVLGILMGCAWQQTSYWRNDETLWTHAAACTSPNALAEYNLGVVMDRQDKFGEAISHYRKALEIDADQGTTSALAHNNLANRLSEQGKATEALAHLEQALKTDPNFAQAYNNLANLLAAQGKVDEAIERFEDALKIDPDNVATHFNLGLTLYGQGRNRQAVAQWREAVRLQPNQLNCLYWLAWALATSSEDSIRNGAEAVDLAQRAAHLSGGREPAILDALAAAYAETGQFPRAVEIAQEALTQASARSDKALDAAIRARIELYQAGSKYRETRLSLPPGSARPERPE